jgi:hypothetical protein
VGYLLSVIAPLWAAAIDIRNRRLFQVGDLLLQASYITGRHDRRFAQALLLAFGFTVHQMVLVSFLSSYFTGSGNFDAVFQAAVRFHLRHMESPPR